MVLAAGVGSRLEPLTTQTPKPLVPVANIPVMEHILKLLKEHNFTDICANLHYMPEEIQNCFGDGSRLGINLNYKYEEELSGDAGGVRACRNFLGNSTFLVLMGDLLTDADLTHIFNEHKRKGALASIALKQVKDVSHFGVALLDGDGFITGFQEKPSPEKALSNLASTGIYVLEPEVFDHIPKEGQFGFGRQLFPSLVEKGLPVLGIEIDTYWSDVGTIAQYRTSNFDALAEHIHLSLPGAKQKGSHNVWISDQATIHPGAKIAGNVLIGSRSTVKEGVELSGTVVIGSDCEIESGARLQDCVIWDGARIGAKAQLVDSVVARHCKIEAGAKLSNEAVVPDLNPAPISALNKG
jgi:mannose-1-phosphate guanylyltransferase/mannose-1-phosphate guanylyltransferase/phosphomannomutase